MLSKIIDDLLAEGWRNIRIVPNPHHPGDYLVWVSSESGNTLVIGEIFNGQYIETPF